MIPYTFPDYRIYLSTGKALSKSEIPSSSLSYQGGYAQTSEYVLRVGGEEARRLYEGGQLEQGLRITEVWVGYAGDLKLVGRDLLIYRDEYEVDFESGESLTVTAYGCLQRLMQSGQRTVRLAARTYAQAAQEVATRHALRIRVGSGAFREVPSKDNSADLTSSSTTGEVTGGIVGGISGTTANPSAAANQKRRQIVQAGETDYDFLADLGKEIGYILAETDLGDALYFGPGLEVGSRPRYLLVAGELVAGGVVQPPNVGRISASRDIYGIPAEMIVTGVERGKRFALVVSPEDLAERVRVSSRTNGLVGAAAGQSGDVTGGIVGGISGTVDTPSRDATTGRFTSTKAGAGDFAGKRVGELLRSSGSAPRRVVGGASSRLDALERGLEGLALEQLRFQEVEVTLYGIPEIKPGSEVVLEGSQVPGPLKGLYLVREVGGTLSGEEGYDMRLILNRNTV